MGTVDILLKSGPALKKAYTAFKASKTAKGLKTAGNVANVGVGAYFSYEALKEIKNMINPSGVSQEDAAKALNEQYALMREDQKMKRAEIEGSEDIESHESRVAKSIKRGDLDYYQRLRARGKALGHEPKTMGSEFTPSISNRVQQKTALLYNKEKAPERQKKFKERVERRAQRKMFK